MYDLADTLPPRTYFFTHPFSSPPNLLIAWLSSSAAPLVAPGTGTGPPGEVAVLTVSTSTPVSVTSSVCSVTGTFVSGGAARPFAPEMMGE